MISLQKLVAITAHLLLSGLFLGIYGYGVMKATQRYIPRIVEKEVPVVKTVETPPERCAPNDLDSFESWKDFMKVHVPDGKFWVVEKKYEHFGHSDPKTEFTVYVEDIGYFDVDETDHKRMLKILRAYFE